jgi:glutathione S-transferase
MDLYFSPLACSLATRIALYEAGAEAGFLRVDNRTKTLEDGSDYLAVNPMGQVPALRTGAGDIVTQNPVVLLTVAEAYPAAGLIAKEGLARTRVLEWMNFITSELHKLVFTPLLDSTSNDGARKYSREKAVKVLGRVDEHLKTREFLVDRFSIADAYLFTVLNWGRATGIDYAEYPAIAAYRERLLKRPSVAKAFGEEFALYQAEQAKKAAA